MGLRANRCLTLPASQGGSIHPEVPTVLEERVLVRQRTSRCAFVPSLRGVIHRDLKLSNLLLARPGDITQVKIADFGLARSAAAAGDAVAAAGTPHYMAPEVVEAALQVGGHGCM